MFKLIFLTGKISDLNSNMILQDYSLSHIKQLAKILIIDDQPFSYQDALRNAQFNIEYKNDMTSLNDAAEYDIILCDIRGVGKFLQSKYEGAYLASQIKKKYPNKIVIIYSAENYNPSFQKYIEYADATLEKGDSLENWTEILEQKMELLVDPVVIWKNTRHLLFEKNVSTAEVAELESKFVRAVKSGKFKSLKQVYERGNVNFTDALADILSSLFVKIITKAVSA